jgi:hypothetical protein
MADMGIELAAPGPLACSIHGKRRCGNIGEHAAQQFAKNCVGIEGSKDCPSFSKNPRAGGRVKSETASHCQTDPGPT